jgi:hypothetical protein
VQEIKCKLQLSLKYLLFGLDAEIKRIHAGGKFHEQERGYEILKERLHQLDSEIEENFKQILELDLSYDFSPSWWQSYCLKYKLEHAQKLQELTCQLNGIENERQKIILLRVEYLESVLEWLLMHCAVHVEDAAHQGGFRNLLLDGWWLEFWEIVLLAAGDVERNPGPRQITDEQLIQVSDIPISKLAIILIISSQSCCITISEEDDLSLIFDALLPVSSRWSRVCCSLGLRASLVDTIKKNHPGDMEECFFEGLKQWVLKNYDTVKHGLPTWRNLVAAVDDSSGGHNHALALKIAEKHKGEYTHSYTHVHTLIII